MSSSLIRASIIIPALNEGVSILKVLERIDESIDFNFECIVVVDSENDSSISFVNKFEGNNGNFRIVVNHMTPGPSSAIKVGINNSKSNVVVVTMADGSDDPECISPMVKLIERGVSIACASRYMPGGQQIGAPLLKSTLSKLAGKSLKIFTNCNTLDATNSFKAYSREFLDEVKIESTNGFELGLEMIAKAIKNNFLIAEIPTIWIERNLRKSNFKLIKWIPSYLKWYFYAIGLRKVGK